MLRVHARCMKPAGVRRVESLALESLLKYRVANAKGVVRKNLDSSERVTGSCITFRKLFARFVVSEKLQVRFIVSVLPRLFRHCRSEIRRRSRGSLHLVKYTYTRKEDRKGVRKYARDEYEGMTRMMFRLSSTFLIANRCTTWLTATMCGVSTLVFVSLLSRRLSSRRRLRRGSLHPFACRGDAREARQRAVLCFATREIQPLCLRIK